MEKALEILKKIKNDKNYCDNCNGLDYCNNFNSNKICELNLCINEAIEELEEAMKPKTCDGCAYCEPFQSVCFNEKSPLCADFVSSKYGCIYHEPKDNA